MRIEYQDAARRDLERFRDFMQANGMSAERINHILDGVIHSITNLEGNPRLGYSIGARYGYQSPYRAYITDPYIAIYKITAQKVEIRRIYHQKEDYLRDILVLEP